MIYRPGETERLWDSWLFAWDGLLHLFYLASHDGEGRIGHCTGTDLVHWERREDIVLSHWPLTGMVLRHEDRFLMPLGEVVDDVQTTTFYESDDLFNWRRLPPEEYRLGPRAPHYATRPDPWRPTAWWRDPFVFHHESDGHYHAIVCAARPEYGPDDTGAALAHVRTKDFRNWEHLPPLDGPTGLFYHNEVPDLFVHDGRYYVLFSTGSLFGLRINTPHRRETAGTYYLMADEMEGPYSLPEDPLLVGAGEGGMAAYVGRTIEFGGERLLYHHVRDDCGAGGWSASWGAPKRLLTGPDGQLSAGYWPGLEKLEAEALPMVSGDPTEDWQRSDGAWRGRAEAVGVSQPVLSDAAEVHVSVGITPKRGGRCGLVLRAADGVGVLVSLDLDLGRAEIGVARRHDVAGWGRYETGFVPGASTHRDRAVVDACGWPLEAGTPCTLRCLARGEHFEVYIDDRWVFTSVIPEAPPGGDVCLYVERGEAEFGDFRAAALQPLERTPFVGQSRPEE